MSKSSVVSWSVVGGSVVGEFNKARFYDYENS